MAKTNTGSEDIGHGHVLCEFWAKHICFGMKGKSNTGVTPGDLGM